MKAAPALNSGVGPDADRICMHAPSVAGGHPLYVKELLTALTHHPRGGNRFELVTGADLAQEFSTDAYPIHPILPRLLHKSTFRNKLAWAVSRLLHYPRCDRVFLEWLKSRPDLRGVHLQEFSLSLAHLSRAIRGMGKSVVYTVHNIRPHAYPPLIPRRLWDHCNRRGCRQADRLIVHTERLRDELSAFLGRPHPPIDVVPHGVWTSSTHEAPPLDERLKWKRLLFFGTIRRNKGLDLLLDAAESLREYPITIAGQPREGEYFRSEVVPRIAELKGRGINIELIDRFVPEEEAARLFASHSAVVLPYTSEFTAQSGVVFLALAHEIPVIASVAGGLRDLFDQFRIGATLEEPSPKALAEAVRECVNHPDLPHLAAQLKSAKEHYSWSAAAGATLASYSAARHPDWEDNDRAFATVPAHQHG